MPKPKKLPHVPVPLASTDLRLAKLLAERKAKEGSYLRLEAAILKVAQESGRESPARGVDRRKLKSIVESDPSVVISIDELRALDRYLERFGQGLAFQPIFDRPDILQCLSESNEVRFLLGSRYAQDDRFKMNMSQWDVLAMAEIQRGVYGFSHNVGFDIRDVRMPESPDPAHLLAESDELQQLLGDVGPARVCLGSSRGNPAAEVMLCRMAGYPPYRSEPLAEGQRPPFHFIWSSAQHHVLPSYFHMTGEEARQIHEESGQDVLERGAAAFALPDGRIVVDRLTMTNQVTMANQGMTYGICLAQRRRSGEIWLLVAGLTGPATFAASRFVKKMATKLYDAPPGRESAVHWSVIQAEAFQQKDRLGYSYRLGEESMVSGPHVWQVGSR